MGDNSRGRSSFQRGIGVPVILVERRLAPEKSLLYELKELAQTAGYNVVGVVTQVRAPDSRYNIGSGKVKEISELIKDTGATKVIFFNELKPHQVYNLVKELKVDVIDRFDLILEVFTKRAGSKEAKMQIELAKLRRELSFARERLRLAKLGELHGFMGGGEYAIDTYYKHVRKRIAKIEDELAKLRARKAERWRRRSMERGLYYVAITGYTGAGKTTLFTKLTNYPGYVDGRPFATLMTKMKRTIIEGRPIVVSDTVGFIDSLPSQLLDAFYTTLGEVVLADVILLVFDVSEDWREIKRKLSASILTLQSLGVNKLKILPVANKIDLVKEEEIGEKLQLLRNLELKPIPVSAKTGEGLDELKNELLKTLPGYVTATIELPSTESVRKLIRNAYVKNICESNGRLIVEVEGREEWIRALSNHG
ncbi:MAG: GTPase HflX [Thermofilaceae archaeon]|nr:GTPase HflX [Thermofilaceae archaeon]MDW8004525.1 GTPase HflX [Thermofilaceae archaeon]